MLMTMQNLANNEIFSAQGFRSVDSLITIEFIFNDNLGL